MTTLHPHTLYEQLLVPAHALKRKNLTIINDICTTLFESRASDFSLAAIGRASEKAGGIGKKALYNPTSSAYQALIRAWADFSVAGRPVAAKPAKAAIDVAFLIKIPDPAVRALVGAAIAERNRLRAEMNLLKAASHIVIDRRRGALDTVSTTLHIPEQAAAFELTDSEQRALEKAISASFLHGEGWSEGAHGEIRNARGRNLFDIGFSTAIRKVLSGQPKRLR